MVRDGAPEEPGRYDVAVAGGGPAGSVAALTLARRGRRVVLVEAGGYDSWRVGETLTPAIPTLLGALGLEDRFDALATLPSNGTRSHWGGSDARTRSFVTNPDGRGWHVDRRAFDRMLATGAEAAGATLHTGTRVAECDPSGEGGWRIELNGEGRPSGAAGTVRVDGLIDATGRTATLGRRLGGRRAVRDRLVGVAMLVRADADAVGRFTLIEAAADGWWYSAPLPDDRAIVTWMTDADLLDDRRRRESMLDALAESGATADRLDGATPYQGPTVASALSHRLRRPVGRTRWLAVGDAAVGVDPLSGRGVERAIDTGVRGGLAMDGWLDGDRQPVEGYRTALDEEFEAYLARRCDYYQMETRWTGAPFWRRRREQRTRAVDGAAQAPSRSEGLSDRCQPGP